MKKFGKRSLAVFYWILLFFTLTGMCFSRNRGDGRSQRATGVQNPWVQEEQSVVQLEHLDELLSQMPDLQNPEPVHETLFASRFPNLGEGQLVKILNKIKLLRIGSNERSDLISLMSMCGCTAIQLRVLIILNQVNDIVGKIPNRHHRLVHTAFAEEGFLQTYLLALSLQEAGYDNIYLNIVAPLAGTSEEISARLGQLRNLPSVRQAVRYSTAREYLQAVGDGHAYRSHSFDMIDSDDHYGEVEAGLVPNENRGLYNNLTIYDKGQETFFFRIFLSYHPQTRVTCGASPVGVGRSRLLEPGNPLKFWNVDEARGSGQGVVGDFCRAVQESVRQDNGFQNPVNQVIALRDELVQRKILRNRLHFVEKWESTNPEFFLLPTYLAYGAESDFEELVDRSKVVDFNPIIYVQKERVVQKHTQRFQPQGLAWGEGMERIL